ncbi:HNH endonuclease [Spirosoma luteum]|uniref:HNH endonuclease n=1 Tax=Spirosoma luteum TaxID=431553 RepID=UPI000377F0B0|nr:HNH endonuclease signature motif containing protein [Spirosoma luteum]
MPRFTISPAVREAVMSRASKCCEYCKSQDKYSPTAFTIDHVQPQSLNGTSDADNLAYACFLCNRLKSNKSNVFDPITEKWFPLFSPRQDTWNEHFAWSEDATQIIGLTAIGRCTVKELRLNREKLVEYRQCIISFGMHPPDS